MRAPPYSVPRTCGSQYIVPNQFFAWCISGSRALSAFFVELGALMMVASTMVPPFIMCPVCTIMRLIASNGIVGLDDTNPFVPGNDFVHDFQKLLPLGFLLAEAVLDIGKCFLLQCLHHRCFDGAIMPYPAAGQWL